MKCAEVALTQNFAMFALQNGGQCFGGKDAEKTFRKYGTSTACCGKLTTNSVLQSSIFFTKYSYIEKIEFDETAILI